MTVAVSVFITVFSFQTAIFVVIQMQWKCEKGLGNRDLMSSVCRICWRLAVWLHFAEMIPFWASVETRRGNVAPYRWKRLILQL